MPDMNSQDGEQEASVKCPSCGADLVLEPKSEDMSEDNMPSMEEAQTMPLDKLRSRLPKKAE